MFTGGFLGRGAPFGAACCSGVYSKSIGWPILLSQRWTGARLARESRYHAERCHAEPRHPEEETPWVTASTTST